MTIEEATEKLKKAAQVQKMLDGKINRIEEHSQKEWDEIWENYRKETALGKYKTVRRGK